MENFLIYNERPINYCPNCSSKLDSVSCPNFCGRCGYYVKGHQIIYYPPDYHKKNGVSSSILTAIVITVVGILVSVGVLLFSLNANHVDLNDLGNGFYKINAPEIQGAQLVLNLDKISEDK